MQIQKNLEDFMSKISYKPLWKILIDKDMKKKDLVGKAHISNFTLNKLAHNDTVTTDTLLKIINLADTKSSTYLVSVEIGMFNRLLRLEILIGSRRSAFKIFMRSTEDKDLHIFAIFKKSPSLCRYKTGFFVLISFFCIVFLPLIKDYA